MLKKNLHSLTKSNLNQVTNKKRLAYKRPNLHYLGALEQVQGYYYGYYIDASGRYYG